MPPKGADEIPRVLLRAYVGIECKRDIVVGTFIAMQIRSQPHGDLTVTALCAVPPSPEPRLSGAGEGFGKTVMQHAFPGAFAARQHAFPFRGRWQPCGIAGLTEEVVLFYLPSVDNIAREGERCPTGAERGLPLPSPPGNVINLRAGTFC